MATLVDLLEADGVVLRRGGKELMGLCPFHAEQTPSFSVNPDKQYYHCFGCGVGGDAITYLRQRHGLSYPEAAQRVGKPLDYWRPQRQHEQIMLKRITREYHDWSRQLFGWLVWCRWQWLESTLRETEGTYQQAPDDGAVCLRLGHLYDLQARLDDDLEILSAAAREAERFAWFLAAERETDGTPIQPDAGDSGQ